MLNVHSSTLNITLRDMRALQAATRRLEDAVNVSQSIIRKFSIKTQQIEVEQRMFKALLNLELALIEISNDTMNLKMGLLSLVQTYVTPMIVSDDNLLGILKEASLKTPGLLFPAVPEYLAMYVQKYNQGSLQTHNSIRPTQLLFHYTFIRRSGRYF